MYPSFVTVTTRNQRGIRILTICGQEYKAYPYDRYIDDAIALAGHWLAHQVTYERIVHLRTWIRENIQHGHNIPYQHLRSMQACRYFVEMVIHAEFSVENGGKMFEEAYRACLEENTQVFANKGKGKG